MTRRACLIATPYIAICGLVCLATVHSVLAANSMQSEKIDAIVKAAGVRSGNIPGAAILVLKGDQVLFEHGYGVADLHSLHKIDDNVRKSSTKPFQKFMLLVPPALAWVRQLFQPRLFVAFLAV